MVHLLRRRDGFRTHCVLALALVAGSAREASRSAQAAAPGAVRPGVILRETHTQSQVVHVDTILTYVTAKHVKVSHAGGHTILDLEHDRILLLDPAAHTYREMSLQAWEARIEAAVGGASQAPDAGGSFEPTGGVVEIAGYTCDRYHHYGKRTLLGTEEYVEQQIWVARALEMPEGAYAAYQRALGSIESIGSGGLRRRPSGVVLGVETRTRPAGASQRDPAQVERCTVYQVEKAALPDSLFAIGPLRPGGCRRPREPERRRTH